MEGRVGGRSGIRNESMISGNEEHQNLRDGVRQDVYQEFPASNHQSIEQHLEKQQKEIECIRSDVYVPQSPPFFFLEHEVVKWKEVFFFFG
jgi:hypothetical protein